MPDWISHILIGLIFAELFNIKKKGLVVLGSLLPDFLAKIYLLSFFAPINDNLLFVTHLYHSPLMAFIIPGLLTPLFRYNWKETYFLTASGFLLHIMADGLGKYFTDSTEGILLYPFSYKFFSLNLLWPEQYWIVLIASLAVYLLIRFVKNYFHTCKRKY
jgi:hypothetical protein